MPAFPRFYRTFFVGAVSANPQVTVEQGKRLFGGKLPATWRVSVGVPLTNAVGTPPGHSVARMAHAPGSKTPIQTRQPDYAGACHLGWFGPGPFGRTGVFLLPLRYRRTPQVRDAPTAVISPFGVVSSADSFTSSALNPK